MLKKIKEIIESAVPESTAYVLNPMQDNVHFEAIVVSKSFEKKPLVRQHQLVMKALEKAFETDVHALALKTFTPEKWELEKPKFEHLLQGES